MTKLSLKTLIVLAIGIQITGLISVLTLLQSADAWHTIFESRKECMYFLKTEYHNTTGEAGRMCDKIIPHTNVTLASDNITTDNKTTIVP